MSPGRAFSAASTSRAWVWAALGGFVVAALVGLAGLALQREPFHRWSRALGRAALVFWITYLPISLWAMETNWNGLFLSEPRWRVAVIFSIGGLALQLGVSLMEDPAWASAGNVVFLVALFFALRTTENVMPPSSPIFSSDAWRIQLFFTALVGLVLFSEWQLARWLRCWITASQIAWPTRCGVNPRMGPSLITRAA